MPSLSHIRHVIVAVLAAIAVLFGSILVAPSAGAEPSAAEQEMAAMVNDYRARNGLPALQLHTGMSSDSRAWSGHMAGAGLAHDANFAVTCERYFPAYSTCSENVGYATGGIGAVQSALEGSSSHRSTLLCACTHLGVGVVESGGKTWVTQRFVHQGQTTSAPAPQYSQAQIDESEPFVRAVYADFVARDPSGADLDHWKSRAVTADQRAQLVHALAYSGESLGAIVDGYYQDALGRPAEAAGRQYWTEQIQRGLPPADLAVRFYASAEHFEGVKQDLHRWVDGLYLEFFGRRADAAGRAHWAAAAQAFGRPAVARALHDSTESVRLRIGDTYQRLLGRSADAVGLQHWTTMLRWTRNDVHLAETVANSAEYRARAGERY